MNCAVKFVRGGAFGYTLGLAGFGQFNHGSLGGA